ncbi:MAG TPA: tRNA lysidine(34) synthetase TilS, partial [Clostridiaceae bacterium]|nr:tRNA lysidine(34) synthetase TilS [Clostridiaceae bacterium]
SLELYNYSLLKEYDYGVELDIEKINEYHSAIRKRVIRKAIEKVKGNVTEIESIHVDKIIELCLEGRTGAEIHLPKGVRAGKSYNILKIYICRDIVCRGISEKSKGKISYTCERGEKNKFFKKVLVPGVTTVEVLNTSLEAVVLDKKSFNVEIFKVLRYNSLVQFFDYDKLLDKEINIRSRQEGDILNPYKCKGTQKLKKYFIDNKIPREIRDTVPLIAKGREIVWVIGYKISDKFKITENTKSILRLEYKKS